MKWRVEVSALGGFIAIDPVCQFAEVVNHICRCRHFTTVTDANTYANRRALREEFRRVLQEAKEVR